MLPLLGVGTQEVGESKTILDIIVKLWKVNTHRINLLQEYDNKY